MKKTAKAKTSKTPSSTCYGGPIRNGQVVLAAGSTLVEGALRRALVGHDTGRQKLFHVPIPELGGVQVDFRVYIKSIKKIKVRFGAIEVTEIDFDLSLWVVFDGSLGLVARMLCGVFQEFGQFFRGVVRKVCKWKVTRWLCKEIMGEIWPDDERIPELGITVPLKQLFVALDVTVIGPKDHRYKVIPKVRLPVDPPMLDAADIATLLLEELKRQLPKPFRGVPKVAAKIVEWMDRAFSAGNSIAQEIRSQVLYRLMPPDATELLAIPLWFLPIYEVPDDAVPGIDSPRIPAKIVNVKADISAEDEVVACFEILP